MQKKANAFKIKKKRIIKRLNLKEKRRIYLVRHQKVLVQHQALQLRKS